MKKFTYLFTLTIVLAGIALVVFSPDIFSIVMVAIMVAVMLAGVYFGIFQVIAFTSGLQNARTNIQKILETKTNSAWLAVTQIEEFFGEKSLDTLFQEYRNKVQMQRENGQIVSDIEEVINENVLFYLSWNSVIRQIPGTMTGLGILGTFVGLLLGIREIGFNTVESALSSVQSILSGIDIAFYTSIAGVILSILFNIVFNILKNMMVRELGLFSEEFHRYVLPAAQEQERFRSRREIQQIIELLERLPKNQGYSLSNAQGGTSVVASSNEQILMPQILEGLKKGEFVFYLQPVYDLNSKRIVGAEALVRWNHSSLGIISPSVFIPLLETNGYITKLDQYIWESIFKKIRQWMDAGLRPSPISLNVTKTDILAMDVGEFFCDMLKKYRIPPKQIEIEIAENVYTQAQNIVHDVEQKLLQVGFGVIIDGFDGDYIKLGDVEQIRTDALKLDLRYFRGEHFMNELAAVFGQADKLNLKVFASGIENMNQLAALKKYGCTKGQGFYFSKPLSVEQFEEKMREERYAKKSER